MPTVHFFDSSEADKDLQGNKGANLVTMTRLGLPVPPGFVVSIEAYKEYRHGSRLPELEILGALETLEQRTGKRLGNGLTVSVRSSAPVSMPGMMDTVLNIGQRSEVFSAVRRIFDSWDNLRAVEYRRLNRIPSDLGTAAVIQAMVMGNADDRSGTGVVFSRDPSTGAKGLFGEYLTQAQGEDLVSGRSTPRPIADLKSHQPEVFAQLDEAVAALEKHFRDMQDIEFTVESGHLYILQTRSGKRSGAAAVKLAVDLAQEGLISRDEAVLRVTPDDLRALLHRRIDPAHLPEPITHGMAAAPGAATGRVVFDPMEAVSGEKKNQNTILVRVETSPDDIQGIFAAQGVLTSRGGLTSHAAIVTRGMGKPCVCGAEEMEIDMAREQFRVGDQVVRKGAEITIDGSSGKVYLGALPLIEAQAPAELGQLLTWADGFRRLGVRANADTPEMVALARCFGAEGIGLCRTERQFNAPERLSAIREFILAETPALRTRALERLRILQKEDFVALFKELQGMPIIIRLLDLPLHEFLPRSEEIRTPHLRDRVKELAEINPMLGHRGVRLGVTSPELYRMQIEAILEARAEVPADVSVMIPQVVTLQELRWVKRYVTDPTLKVGVMMETVRACMRADQLAQEAAFFSFGTNDLTQVVYSFSREDVEKKFLSTYLELGILEDNPFEVVDIKGMGRLMETAIAWAKAENMDLEIGVCGEHGGEPRSVKYFHRAGVDYVSCSPFKIPVARLAAAQAVLEEKATSALQPVS